MITGIFVSPFLLSDTSNLNTMSIHHKRFGDNGLTFLLSEVSLVSSGHKYEFV